VRNIQCQHQHLAAGLATANAYFVAAATKNPLNSLVCDLLTPGFQIIALKT
jgi:hypothetical protein